MQLLLLLPDGLHGFWVLVAQLSHLLRQAPEPFRPLRRRLVHAET